MGLDMYLEGRVFRWSDDREKRDGYEVRSYILELGYWRKHPNLHGFIVQNFAGGKDECQDIPLTAEDLETLILAVKEGRLPHTEGFFFGASDGSERESDIDILSRALAWLESVPTFINKPKSIGGVMVQTINTEIADQTKEIRDVVYRASW